MTDDASEFYGNLPDNRKHKDIERMIEEGSKVKGKGQSGRDRSKKTKVDSESKFNGTAAVLSALLPGLGQIYNGEILLGLLIPLLVIAGLFLFVVPGIIVWVLSVVQAGGSQSN